MPSILEEESNEQKYLDYIQKWSESTGESVETLKENLIVKGYAMDLGLIPRDETYDGAES